MSLPTNNTSSSLSYTTHATSLLDEENSYFSMYNSPFVVDVRRGHREGRCATGGQQQRSEQASVCMEAISFESKMVGGYMLGETLGSGSCAIVKLGTHCTTGKKVAVKIVRPTTLREQKEVIREVEALQLLKRHPHIVRLLRVLREGNYTCLILELGADGDLFEYMLQTGKMSETQARIFFRQLISAVQFSHAHLVVHRDLKPENVLIDASGIVKISDFGLSNIVRPGKLCSTFCGSPIYCPPEVVLQQQYNGFLVDVWSLGVILYVMVTGGMPWRLEKNVVKNIDDLIAANYVIPDCLGISTECRQLIKMMLTADSNQRASVNKIANHPWVSMEFAGPPDVYLKPQSVVKKHDINEEAMQQLEALGFVDPLQARLDIQTNPSSPALTAYHILLEKHMRLTRLENISIDTALQHEDHQLAHPHRQRAATLPKNNINNEDSKKPSSPYPCSQTSPPFLLPAQLPLPNAVEKEKLNICNNNKGVGDGLGILHNLFIYFEKFKQSKKATKKKDYVAHLPTQHNSPRHSPSSIRKRA